MNKHVMTTVLSIHDLTHRKTYIGQKVTNVTFLSYLFFFIFVHKVSKLFQLYVSEFSSCDILSNLSTGFFSENPSCKTSEKSFQKVPRKTGNCK